MISGLYLLICLYISISHGLPLPSPPTKPNEHPATSSSISRSQQHHHLDPAHGNHALTPWYSDLSQSEIDMLRSMLHGHSAPHTQQQASVPSLVHHSEVQPHHDESWVDDLLLDHPSPRQVEYQGHSALVPSSPSITEYPGAQPSISQSPVQTQAPPLLTHTRPSTTERTRGKSDKRRPPANKQIPFKRMKSRASANWGPNARRWREYPWQDHFEHYEMNEVYRNVAKHWRPDIPSRTLSTACTHLRSILNLKSAKKILKEHEPTTLHFAAQAAPNAKQHIDFRIGADGAKIPETETEMHRHYLDALKEHPQGHPSRQNMKSTKMWPHESLTKGQTNTIRKQLNEHWGQGRKDVDDMTRSRLRHYFHPGLTPGLLSHKSSPEFKQAARYLEAQTAKGYPAYVEQVNLAKKIRSRQV